MALRLQPLLLFLGVVLSACSVPQTRNVEGLIGQEKVCFKTSTEMRFIKAFKPGLLSGYQWELQVLTDWPSRPSWWSVHTTGTSSSEKNSIPKGDREVLDASNATHVSRGKVLTTWDFENGYRIEIYGIAHFNSGDLNFRYRKFGSAPFDPQEVVHSIFQECAQ